MAEASDDAAPVARSTVHLECFATEVARLCTNQGRPVTLSMRPDTRPFPTLVVSGRGVPINVLAGRRVLWFERSEREPDGIFHVGYRLLGDVDAPKVAAARVAVLLRRWEASEDDDAGVSEGARR